MIVLYWWPQKELETQTAIKCSFNFIWYLVRDIKKETKNIIITTSVAQKNNLPHCFFVQKSFVVWPQCYYSFRAASTPSGFPVNATHLYQPSSTWTWLERMSREVGVIEAAMNTKGQWLFKIKLNKGLNAETGWSCRYNSTFWMSATV